MIQIYNIPVNDQNILVVRSDLLGDGIIYPPWGKISALKHLIEKEIVDKTKPFAHLAVYGSWSGWALSKICQELGIKFINVYPKSGKYPDGILKKISNNGAENYPLKFNVAPVLYSQLKKIAFNNNWVVLNYGFDNPEYVNFIENQCSDVIKTLGDIDNFIVSSGSGITTLALARACKKHGVKNLYSICVSSEKTIKKKLQETESYVNIIKSPYGFSDLMKDYPVDFPCNRFWDLKAWRWTKENINKLNGTTVFWNLGGNCEFYG